MRKIVDFTGFEQATLEEIFHYQDRTLRCRELLVCVDEKGSIEVARAEGEVDHVVLPDSLDELRSAGVPIRLFHNHPSGNSLSATDWRQSARWDGAATIVVVTDQGSVFCGAARRSAELVGLLSRVDFDAVRDDCELALLSRRSGGGGSAFRAQARFLSSHLMNLRLSTMGLAHYDADLSGHDIQGWDALTDCGDVAFLSGWIETYLQPG